MNKIQTFEFNKKKLDQVRTAKYGKDWPAVYLLEDGKELYVGESIDVHNRMRQHLENPDRSKLKNLHIISDHDFNKSSALDTESWLIQYLLADGRFVLQNANSGLKNHSYYQRDHYEAKFYEIWDLIIKKGLARNTLRDLKNSDLFKYSPYKTLNDEQYLVAESILMAIESTSQKTFLIHGRPGTGKTILAVYLTKYLIDKVSTKDLKIGLVVPMTSLRNTLKKVFRSVKGLKSSMVLGPNDVVKDQYDLLIVDEAHRLMRRKNLTNFPSYDNVNKKLGLNKEADQLEWIKASSKYQILFYDAGQTVKPSDVQAESFSSLGAESFTLKTQMRVDGGDGFLNFIDHIFDGGTAPALDFGDYDFKIFDDVGEMYKAIRQKDKEYGLARMVAGYAWDWKTKDPKNGFTHDIEIGSYKFKWNSESSDWVNSEHAINEVGCIHTVQGYDLNYVGVIVGPELTYSSDTGFEVLKANYKDRNGKRGIEDDQMLKEYVLNIYKVLLTRGIKGCYVHFIDKALQNRFESLK